MDKVDKILARCSKQHLLDTVKEIISDSYLQEVVEVYPDMEGDYRSLFSYTVGQLSAALEGYMRYHKDGEKIED
jgi:hypothetical protein